MSGKVPHNYKGGTITKSGSRNIDYIEVRIDGKRYKKHRYLIEKLLGRKLNKEEVVHHINGDGLDNRINNLLITTHKEHLIMHRSFK